MSNVMVDLETLGRRAGCAILSIGAVVFDPRTQTLGEELYVTVNTESCTAAGLHTDPDTLDWWTQQSDAARAVLNEAATGGVQLHGALSVLNTFLERQGDVHLWGNGADFDNAILQYAYGAVDLEPAWKFWNNRCYRTLKGLNSRVKMRRTGVHHNALADAKSQAEHALALLRHYG